LILWIHRHVDAYWGHTFLLFGSNMNIGPLICWTRDSKLKKTKVVQYPACMKWYSSV